MPKSSNGALAPKFLVITDSPHFTRCTGTRDQLISLGVALPEHFPEGRKRVNYALGCDFRIEKRKGCLYGLRKWHKQLVSKQNKLPLKELRLFEDPVAKLSRSWNAAPSRPCASDAQLIEEIHTAADQILGALEDSEPGIKTSRLPVVKQPWGKHP